MDLHTVVEVVSPAEVGQWRPGDAWLGGGTALFGAAQPGVTRLGSRLIGAAFNASGIDTRHTVVDELDREEREGESTFYDARSGGGFPQPALPPPCSGEACQGPPALPPPSPAPASSTSTGPGNPEEKPTKCKPGFVRKAGKCVKRKHPSRRHKGSHRSHARRRVGRNRGSQR